MYVFLGVYVCMAKRNSFNRKKDDFPNRKLQSSQFFRVALAAKRPIIIVIMTFPHLALNVTALLQKLGHLEISFFPISNPGVHSERESLEGMRRKRSTGEKSM